MAYNYYVGSYGSVIKYDTSNTVLWTFTNMSGRIEDLETDGSNVYIIDDNDDLIKVDSTGNLVWEYADVSSFGGSIALDLEGNIFIATNSGKSLKKIDSTGNLVWERTFTTNTSDVAVDIEGNVYVIEIETAVYKYDTTGNLIKTYPLIYDYRYISLDLNKDIYLSNASLSGDIIKKINQDGTTAFTVQGAGESYSYGVVVDKDGLITHAGRNGSVTQYNGSGVIWNYNTGNYVYDIGLNPDDEIFAVNYSDEVYILSQNGELISSFNTGEFRSGKIAVDPGLYGAGFWPKRIGYDNYTNSYEAKFDEELFGAKVSFTENAEVISLGLKAESVMSATTVQMALYDANTTSPTLVATTESQLIDNTNIYHFDFSLSQSITAGDYYILAKVAENGYLNFFRTNSSGVEVSINNFSGTFDNSYPSFEVSETSVTDIIGVFADYEVAESAETYSGSAEEDVIISLESAGNMNVTLPLVITHPTTNIQLQGGV